jgi:hypothetical protein
MEYKIINSDTLGKFDSLEDLLNDWAIKGWFVVCMIHDDILLGREL